MEGEGPPLLLHLGAGCDSGLWRKAGYLDPLSRSYTCILFDHRGHGESDKPRGAAAYHIDRLTADVVELLDHLGLHSVAFWGYSAGIDVGVKVAELHPMRIWALVASGSLSPPDSPEDLAAWVKTSAAAYRESGWEKLIARFEAQEPDPIPEWMKARIRATDVEQYVHLIESYPDWNWEAWDVFPRLGTPVLFISGELEDPDDDMGRLVEHMQRGQLLRMPRRGHINAFLESDAVLPAVGDFLAAHAPPKTAKGAVTQPVGMNRERNS